MPNAHSADKEVISFYVPRTLAVRVRKAAAMRDESLTEYLNSIFTKATLNVELTEEDYDAIAKAVARAKKHKDQRCTVLAGASRTARKTKSAR